jgi:predicted PurR-regulated permease PerM
VDNPAPEDRPAGPKGAAAGTVAGMLERPAGIRQLSLIGLFSIGLLYTIHIAKPVLVPVMMAMLLNFIFKPFQRMLLRFGLNRIVAATVILIAILGVIAVGGYTLATPFVDWVERIPANVRQADAKLDRVTGAIKRLGRAAQQVEEITEMQEPGARPSVEIRERRFTLTVIEVAQQLFVFLMLSLILLFFMLVYGDILLAKLSAAGGTLEVLGEIHDYMSKYLFTITTINAILGLCVAVAMYLLGMPNPMLWGAMCALLNFVPYLGAWVGVGTITLVSLVTFDATLQIAWCPLSISC